jgi:glycosyltransferase involved in cell wall biosynthesis
MAAVRSASHLVVIPSYNTGDILYATVREARRQWAPVWVVIDGSDDGTADGIAALAADDPDLRVLRLARNGGKGAAVLHGAAAAADAGFSHVLTMDADGQHPADEITRFMTMSRLNPARLIAGVPQFGPEAPRLRVWGRRLSNGLAALETGGAGIGDCLFGFRVYPIAPLLRVMAATRWARRFDFDPEVAVRLCWAGVRPIAVPARVRYVAREAGGVSHFRYGRDNFLLAGMHGRLVWERLKKAGPDPNG